MNTVNASLTLLLSQSPKLLILSAFFKARKSRIQLFNEQLKRIEKEHQINGLKDDCFIDQHGNGFAIRFRPNSFLPRKVIDDCYEAFDKVFG